MRLYYSLLKDNKVEGLKEQYSHVLCPDMRSIADRGYFVSMGVPEKDMLGLSNSDLVTIACKDYAKAIIVTGTKDRIKLSEELANVIALEQKDVISLKYAMDDESMLESTIGILRIS